jgi:hypothetical protein
MLDLVELSFVRLGEARIGLVMLGHNMLRYVGLG